MNYYPHHIGDYRADTSHLSLLEHGAYRQLLDWYYLNEKPIPSETQVVYRRLSAKTEADKLAIDSVLKDFFLLTEEGYKQVRCDMEIAAYVGKADAARTNGKLGGRPKKTQSVILANPAKTGRKANQEPRTKNQEPNTAPDGFDAFWQKYPKKVSKPSAVRAFKRVKEHLGDILQHLEVATVSDGWTKSAGQFVPNPATYLNDRRWEDADTKTQELRFV